MRRKRSFLKEFPFLIVVALVVSLFIKTFIVQFFFIPSGSMENTLQIDDRVAVNRIPFISNNIKRGDVVVFRDPDNWLPAADIEAAVLEQIQQALRVPELMLATWRSCQKHPQGARLEEAQVVVAMQRIGAVWDQLFPKEQQRITQLLIERVQLHDRGLDILWREDGWLGLGEDIGIHPLVNESRSPAEEVYA